MFLPSFTALLLSLSLLLSSLINFPVIADDNNIKEVWAQNSSGSGVKDTMFQQYENLPFKVRIKYPSSWDYDEKIDATGDWRDLEIHSYHHVVLFYLPGHADEYGVEILVGRLGDETLEQYMDIHTSFYASAREDFKLLESGTNHTLSNRPAYKIVYTDVETGYNSTSTEFDYKWIDTGTIDDRMVFYVQYYAQPQYYSKFLPIAQKMIDSFEIFDMTTKPPPTSPQVSANSYTYKNYSNHGIELIYPANWNLSDNITSDDEINKIVKFDSGSYTSYSENIVISKTKVDKNADLNILAAERIQSYRQDPLFSSSFTLITSDKSEGKQRLFGLPSYRLFYSVLNPNGGSDIILNNEIGTIVGDEVYYITYSALLSRFSEYSDILQKMIDSLRIHISTPDLVQQQQMFNEHVPEI